MVARFDGQPKRRREVMNSRYFDHERGAYYTPCVRCGRFGQAEACRDCREVDPDNYGDCMQAREWQKFMRAKWRRLDNADFHLTVYGLNDGRRRDREAS